MKVARDVVQDVWVTSSCTAPPRAQRSLSLNVAKKGTLNRIRSCVNVADELPANAFHGAHRLLVAQVPKNCTENTIVARAWVPPLTNAAESPAGPKHPNRTRPVYVREVRLGGPA